MNLAGVSSTSKALHRHHSGEGLNPHSGMNFSGVSHGCLSSAKV